MTGKLYINGIDAWVEWGVFLENGSYNKFLAGENMKPYTENKSRSIDGKLVSIKNPRVEDRDLAVVFCFADKGNLPARMNSFLNVLRNGKIIEGKHYPLEIQIPELSQTYKLIYIGNTTLEQMQLSIGKIAVKFNEPNPADK